MADIMVVERLWKKTLTKLLVLTSALSATRRYECTALIRKQRSRQVAPFARA